MYEEMVLRNSYLSNWKDFRGSDTGILQITADSCKIKHCAREKKAEERKSDKRTGNDL